MESNTHFNITNNTDEDLRDLNLYLVVERLEEGQATCGDMTIGQGYQPPPRIGPPADDAVRQ